MIESEKRIPLDANSFEAGGKTFIIHASVCIDRYTEMDELIMRSGYGSTYVQLNRGYRDWVDLHNKGRGFEANVKMSNMFEGVPGKLAKQYDALILICTLFMCEKDEDRSVWDEASATEKVKIWSKEGYPTEDFLNWGTHYVRLYQHDYINGSPDFSESQAE